VNYVPLFAQHLSTAVLPSATLKGPHIDFAGLSPLIALLGGATLVLMVGLLDRGGFARRSCRRSA